MMADEEGARLLPNKESSVAPGQQRGCCMRILCLVFCCDTSNIGSQSHLNALTD